MGHDDDGAVEVLDGLDQRIDGLHVQVVRGLVEQEQVRGRDQELAQQHPALLAARKHAHFLERVVAFEHHEPADGARLALCIVRVRVHDLLERGLLGPQAVDVGLAEIGDLRVRVELDVAGRGRHLVRQQVQERGLSLAVLSDHGDAVLLAHAEGEAVDQLRARS